MTSKSILEVEIHTLTVILKSIVQNAVNTVMDVLEKLVEAVVK